jgi:hypothetical protein
MHPERVEFYHVQALLNLIIPLPNLIALSAAIDVTGPSSAQDHLTLLLSQHQAAAPEETLIKEENNSRAAIPNLKAYELEQYVSDETGYDCTGFL